MITLRHLEIYQSFKGDSDGFIRFGTPREKTIMTDKYWSLVECLIQDLRLINTGLVAESYIEKFDEKVHKSCYSAETITELKKLAS